MNKQNISSLKRKNSESLEEIRPAENVNRINSRWLNDELLLAVQGVRKYGKDFQVNKEYNLKEKHDVIKIVIIIFYLDYC